jgi:cell division inhibitor SepF
MGIPQQVNPQSVIIITPRYFEEEQYIADQLLQGRVVLIDFKYMDDAIKQRMISFLEGALFGIDGKKVVLRENLFILLPRGALFEDNVENKLKPYERQVLSM